MTVSIDRHISMPPKGNGGLAKYPWDKMKVGDSFKVDGRTNGAQLCFQANRTRAPKKFESRVIKGETRVWRTA